METEVDKVKEYTILAVDDAKDSLMLLEFDLADNGYQVIAADSGESALSLLENMEADLILLDMQMPGMSGIATLQVLKSKPEYKNIPVIMLSASDDEDAIVSALELGADDYVTKPYIPNVLLARIRNSIRFMEKTRQLEILAKTDSLTTVNNRGSFRELANACISQTKRTEQFLSMAMFDLDLFKQVNDNYGHEAGDKALIDFASILKSTFRDYDIIGRVGGEEFAVCMPDTNLADAFLACERCRTTLESHLIKLTHNDKLAPFSLTVSIGVSGGQGQSLNFDALLRHADAALYQAKEGGRNQTTLDEEVLKNQTDTHFDANQLLDDLMKTENGNEKIVDGSDYPGIDYQLGVNNVLGDDQLFSEILLMFHQDHSEDGVKIINSIIENNYSLLKSTVHTLKGVACSIGAMQLFEYCKSLDHAVNDNEQNSFQLLAEPVVAELTKVQQGITNKLL